MRFMAFSSLPKNMVKVVSFLLLLSLSLLGLTDAGQEAVELINLYDSYPLFIHSLSLTSHFPISISVTAEDLPALSSSLSEAESWLKTHVIATKATSIVVGKGALCNSDYLRKWSLVLPTLINLYHVLQRLGLEKVIKVSAAFSNDCFLYSSSYKDDLILKPLLGFLQTSNSTYAINPPHHFSSSLGEIITLVSVHETSIKKLGFSNALRMNVIVSHLTGKPMERMMSSLSCYKPEEPNPSHFSASLGETINLESTLEANMKKLGFYRFISILREKPIVRKLVESYPARPTPLPDILSPSPIHSSIGFSVPAIAQKNPFSPAPQTMPPPEDSFSFSPDVPPVVIPANPPGDSTLPPCLAAPAPAPETGEQKGLWCVAKPSVPSDTLQEAMDYACGEGAADCEEIRPNGTCYFPDTVVAHASFAFNSYWQKYKNSGGSCSFGGTAMIINSDPSFLQCKFVLL
ncbi:hypothetical protein AAC387_Pa03g4204 [Persea americana]